ncbi:type VI lipase adapter Tla3 domain-containing protein, partial [Pseudomonas aeruginosa]
RVSYDLTQRLGDTGAASPFVGITQATMASYLNGDSSLVMPLRRKDQATLIGISTRTPGKKPVHDPFGVDLLPQTASG